jgi:transposase
MKNGMVRTENVSVEDLRQILAEVVYNKPREGRPSKLSDKEHDQFVEALHDSPEEVGYNAPAWSVPSARHYPSEAFGVEYQ